MFPFAVYYFFVRIESNSFHHRSPYADDTDMIHNRHLLSLVLTAVVILSHCSLIMGPTIVGPFRVLAGKKGAAFALKREENHFKIRTLNPYWYYSWSPASPPIYQNDTTVEPEELVLRPPNNVIEFLPMFWGYYPTVFEERIQEALSQRPRMLMGFNEPDKIDQSNMPVKAALEAWPILEDAIEKAGMAGEILLVSPSCADPLGEWMTTFMEMANEKKLQIDIIGVHHYGAPNVQAFQDRMKTIYKSYGGRPLLLTELGVADWQATSVEDNRYSPEQVLVFMEMILPWMQAQDWIVGYSWFSFDIDNLYGTSSALFDSNNELTPLGKYYVSFTGQ